MRRIWILLLLAAVALPAFAAPVIPQSDPGYQRMIEDANSALATTTRRTKAWEDMPGFETNDYVRALVQAATSSTAAETLRLMEKTKDDLIAAAPGWKVFFGLLDQIDLSQLPRQEMDLLWPQNVGLVFARLGVDSPEKLNAMVADLEHGGPMFDRMVAMTKPVGVVVHPIAHPATISVDEFWQIIGEQAYTLADILPDRPWVVREKSTLNRVESGQIEIQPYAVMADRVLRATAWHHPYTDWFQCTEFSTAMFMWFMAEEELEAVGGFFEVGVSAFYLDRPNEQPGGRPRKFFHRIFGFLATMPDGSIKLWFVEPQASGRSTSAIFEPKHVFTEPFSGRSFAFEVSGVRQ